MVLQHINATTVGLKMAHAHINIGHNGHIRIGDRDIEGPGEYDIAGVGVHAFVGMRLYFPKGYVSP